LDIAATPRFSKAAIAIPNLIEARKGGYELHSSEFFLSATDLWSTGRNGRGLTSPSLAINLPDSAPAEMSASGGSIPLASGSGWGVAGAAGLDIAATPRISKAAIAIPNLIEARKGGYEPAAIEAPGSIVSTVRSYRSQIDYNGPLGHGWDFGANARVVPEVGDIRVYDGRGRADLFVRTGPTTFNSPPGIYKVLIQNPDASFTLRDPDGTLRDFHRFNGSNLEGALARVADRNGNFTSLLYDHQGLLKTIVDTMGRSTHYAYDAMGRITAITDFAGRQVQYSYDAAGNLASVRSPVVTGTPNGNDFPAGKLTTYRYSSGFADERLNHNLTGIVRPNEAASGAAALQISYGTGTEGFDLDRVTAETIGGTNATGIPAGGSLSFTYESLNPGQPPDPVTPRRRATVLDRNGNQKEFVHNHAGNILVRTDFTNRGLRPGEGNYTTLYSYSTEGERLESVLPAGNRIQFTYDSASPNRGSHGNLLEIRAVPDNPGAAGGRGDGHGNAAAERVWTFTYDDFFNGLLSATDPRGNDPAYVPQNGGTQSAARYTAKLSYDLQEGDPATNGINALSMRFGITPRTTPLGLGDLNGDGRTDLAGGNPVRLERPAVLLDPASNQAAIGGDTSQEIVTLYEWNDLGQPTAVTDPEGNRHQYAHWPETDPDGDGVMFPPPDDGRVLNPTTGGYLKTVRYDTIASPGRDNGTDPTPTMIQHDFEYDDVGNVTGFIDGRGVLTRYIVNSLNQVVEVRRAAATADLSGPDGDPPTGRGETSDILPRTVPVGFKTRYSYDANDNLVRVEVEDRGATRGVGPFLDTTFAYDILDDLLSVSREATPVTSLVTQFRYDANENRVQVMQPEGNAHSSSWDERDLLLSRITGASGPRAGVPASRSYEYDGNGNLVRLTDARGGLVDFAHDGFDRLARRTDQVGNTGDYSYDPAGMVVRSLRRGPVGGPTPADRSGSTNVDLADARLLYDELGRLFRIDRALFVPTGATPARAPILAEGPGIPADGFINSVFEYDRLSRLSFSHRDSAATTRYDYDGAGRVLRTTLPQGVEVLQATYDAGHNLVETVERELALTGAGASIEEQFLTTAFYDALNRREIVFDNLGQTRRAVYDSLDAVVAASDARGPAGGTINRRSPGNQGISVPVNAHGNITRFGYDGAGRLLTATRVLTTTGEGDGTLAPPPDDGNVFNPDGLVTLTTLWDGNSLPAKGLDDRGNETIYAYDNLNRLVLRTGDDGTMNLYGLDPQGNLVSLTDPNGSEFAYSYDAAHRRVGVEVTPAAGIPGTTEQTFQYDGLDRLTRATDNNSPSVPGDDVTILFTYDSLSRLVEEGQAGGLLAPLRTTDYGWRAEDLMTDRIYPDGRRIGYQYDAADRLVLVDDVDDIRPEQMTYDYFGLDRVHTRTSAAGGWPG
jgi:YD repeat-containing protein